MQHDGVSNGRIGKNAWDKNSRSEKATDNVEVEWLFKKKEKKKPGNSKSEIWKRSHCLSACKLRKLSSGGCHMEGRLELRVCNG